MSYSTPKTDWTATDFYNATDYNRMVDNLVYIHDIAKELYGDIYLMPMETGKAIGDNIYARHFNSIEDNLELFNKATYNLDIGQKVTYYPNGPVPEYMEYNRIEDAESKLFAFLYGQSSIMTHLAFTLGGATPFGARVKYVKEEPMAHRLSYRLGTNKGGI